MGYEGDVVWGAFVEIEVYWDKCQGHGYDAMRWASMHNVSVEYDVYIG